MKRLILNADDFGYSKVFNASILELLEKKYIQSTTVMVHWISEEQKSQVKQLCELQKQMHISVGLHLELDEKNIFQAFENQYQKFIEIFGVSPSHVDVHKPTKTEEEKKKI